MTWQPAKPHLTLVHILSRPDENWTGETGHPDRKKIEKYCSNVDGRKANDGQQNHERLKAQTVNQWAILFKNKGCAHCHAVDSAQNGIGPSLKGLFKGKEKLLKGRPLTDKSVRDQIKRPYKNMPPFADRLNEKEMDQIVIYLKTL